MPIPLMLSLLFAVAVLGVRAGAVIASDRDTLICGTLTAHERSSAERTGSVTIGGTTVVLAAEPLYSAHPGTQERLRVGTAICFSATYDPAGEAFQYLVNAMPDPMCAKVISIERPSATRSGSARLEWLGTGTFAIPAGTDVGPDTFPGQPCFRLALDPAGRAQVVGRVLTVADRTALRLSACGLVVAWDAPTRVSAGLLRHDSAGTIRIGTRTYVIAAGTEYSTVNASPVVGEPTCLSAALDADGLIIEYAAQPGLLSPVCASAPVEYVAPTAMADGAVVTHRGSIYTYTAGSFRYRIPAGTAMPADAASGAYCWVLSLDAGGDAIVTGARERPPVEGVATAPRTSPAIGSLPNTSTAPSREAFASLPIEAWP
ncbi:MAG TPA: hypothetical protein VFW12_06540 [Candidatus Limnocylindria bacterium]|nr:hypothetical protein [Candidatus Limnocylindria bacterium]